MQLSYPTPVVCPSHYPPHQWFAPLITPTPVVCLSHYPHTVLKPCMQLSYPTPVVFPLIPHTMLPPHIKPCSSHTATQCYPPHSALIPPTHTVLSYPHTHNVTPPHSIVDVTLTGVSIAVIWTMCVRLGRTWGSKSRRTP